ncbi:MAG: hypothetical protein AAGF24_15915 [Cyanobacteria bacterium P01_H01_bin.121]
MVRHISRADLLAAYAPQLQEHISDPNIFQHPDADQVILCDDADQAGQLAVHAEKFAIWHGELAERLQPLQEKFAFKRVQYKELMAQPEQVKRPGTLTAGWLLERIQTLDTQYLGRWDYWKQVSASGQFPGYIPIIRFPLQPEPQVLTHMKQCVALVKAESRRGWDDWEAVEYFTEFLLWALGHPGYPKPPSGKAWWRLASFFEPEFVMAVPYDYLGEILMESTTGKLKGLALNYLGYLTLRIAHYMDVEADSQQQPCFPDLACGTGRHLLCFSSFYPILTGMEVDSQLAKICLVNGYFYMPWFIQPGWAIGKSMHRKSDRRRAVAHLKQIYDRLMAEVPNADERSRAYLFGKKLDEENFLQFFPLIHVH